MSQQGTEETDADERCRVITEVAIEKAMDKCDSEAAVKNQLARIVGLDDEDEHPDCSAVMASGLDVATLANTRETRQWVYCEAWRLVEEDEMTLASAVAKAWAEARQVGEEEGFEV